MNITRQQQDEKVMQIIAEVLAVKPSMVTMDAVLENDLAADSIDAFEIMLAIEKEFAIEFPDDVFDNLEEWTVQSVCELTEQLINRKKK